MVPLVLTHYLGIVISRDEVISKVEKLRTEFNDNPQYKILANMEELKNRVGEIIQLPPIPISTYPKGFEKYSSRHSYLLTKQRFHLLKEVDDFFRLDLEQDQCM